MRLLSENKICACGIASFERKDQPSELKNPKALKL